MKKTLCALCACLLMVQAGACSALAEESTAGKTLILYYSRTGNTKLACEVLAKELGADMLEIKDGADRSGGWGFFTGAVNTVFNMQTDIAPEKPDLSPYARIIIASPIWGGKLASAIRTFLGKNSLMGKKTGVLTTTNSLLKQSSRERNSAAVHAAGGTFVGYWEIAVQEKTDGGKREKTPGQITKEALALASALTAAFGKPGTAE